MNLELIQKAEALRQEIEKIDREIIQVEKIMHELSEHDDYSISLSVNRPVKVDTGDLVADEYGTVVNHLNTVTQNFIRQIQVNRGHVIGTESLYGTFSLDSYMALEFLTKYQVNLMYKRNTALLSIRDCIKDLKIID